MKPPVVAFAIAFSLTACGPLVQIGGNAKPPVSLLTLNATAVPRAADPRVSAATSITVAVPGVPGALQTLRIPVTTTDTEITYLAGGSWAEQPAKLFQRVVADTLTASGRGVVDPRQSPVAAAWSLTGTLRDFGLDVRDPAAAVVRVRYDAQFTGPAGRVAVHRFETTEPAPDQSPAGVAAALNRAANRVAAQVDAAFAP